MLKDIFNKPQTLILEDKTYKMEFDNTAYAMMEENTGKGVFQILDNFISESPHLTDLLEAVYCGLLKHYGIEEIEKVKTEFSNKKYLLINNLENIAVAFIQPLIPPEVSGAKKQSASASKKKSVINKKKEKTKI